MRKLLSVIALMTVVGTAWASDLPNVRILAVGGTIAGTAASSTQSSYKAGQLGVDTLISAVPEIGKIADVKGEQFLNIGSGNLTDDDILALAKRVNEVAADASTDAIVITHGTDTLEETAWFLNLTAKTTKPIVMVGAMRPATAISADGPANLLDAVRCAADSQSVGKGVMVVMNNEIHNARDVTKMDVTEVSAFQAPTTGAVGRIVAGKVIYFKTSIRTHTNQSEFDVSKIDRLPRVDIIYSHLGDDGLLARAAIQAGAKGIVNAGTGNGTVSKHLFPTLKKAADEGVVVVRSSRVPGGVVCTSKPDWDRAGFISSGSLNPQKSRILLQLALTKTQDKKIIEKMFEKY